MMAATPLSKWMAAHRLNCLLPVVWLTMPSVIGAPPAQLLPLIVKGESPATAGTGTATTTASIVAEFEAFAFTSGGNGTTSLDLTLDAAGNVAIGAQLVQVFSDAGNAGSEALYQSVGFSRVAYHECLRRPAPEA